MHSSLWCAKDKEKSAVGGVLVVHTMRNRTRQHDTIGGTEARRPNNPGPGTGILHVGVSVAADKIRPTILCCCDMLRGRVTEHHTSLRCGGWSRSVVKLPLNAPETWDKRLEDTQQIM